MRLAFPDDKDVPPGIYESCLILGIAGRVRRELRLPIASVRLGSSVAALAARMLMPETPVNEDDLPHTGEDEIRLAGQVASMEPEAIAKPMHQGADAQLRLGVLRANPAHDPTSDLLRDRVSHSLSSIRQLGSVSQLSTISLYLSMSLAAVSCLPSRANCPSS